MTLDLLGVLFVIARLVAVLLIFILSLGLGELCWTRIVVVSSFSGWYVVWRAYLCKMPFFREMLGLKPKPVKATIRGQEAPRQNDELQSALAQLPLSANARRTLRIRS